MPQLPENIGEIVNDPEFQNFFQDFASNLVGGAGEESKDTEGGAEAAPGGQSQ